MESRYLKAKDLRQQKGLEIAKQFKNKMWEAKNGDWHVPSQSGRGEYIVRTSQKGPICTCPDSELRQVICKHIWAVDYVERWEYGDYGDTILRRRIRLTYKQNWKAYNKAQVNEGPLFLKLLADLCSHVEQPKYRFGRPSLLLSDMVFASALKVYSTFSLRRFMAFIERAKAEGFIDQACSYVTVSNYMRKPEMTAVLQELIKLSSLPLASVEDSFAVDSSGFSTCRFARYFSYKHERDLKYRRWLKAHLMCGTKTNVITAVEVTEERRNDCPLLKPLVERTAKGFNVKEVSADKAYSSRNNIQLVDDMGATAYIPFKVTAKKRAGGSSAWKKMYHYFQFRRDEFLKHYHKRSNVETAFHMMKTKFKDSLRSKDGTAQVNEILLKVLCHNICVLIQEIHEFSDFSF